MKKNIFLVVSILFGCSVFAATHTLMRSSESDLEITSYTLIGDSLIFGSEFDFTDTDNDLAYGSLGNDLWSLMYENVLLSEGSYAFKVVANYDQAVYQFPEDELNQYLAIEQDGLYYIGFSFNGKDADVPELIAHPILITSISTPKENNIYALNGRIISEGDFQIFTLTGVDVTAQNGQLKGNYIVKINGGIAFVINVQ